MQRLISTGVDEGAVLVIGETEGRNVGHFMKPTVLGGVTRNMTITREEIFGPVLSILP